MLQDSGLALTEVVCRTFEPLNLALQSLSVSLGNHQSGRKCSWRHGQAGGDNVVVTVFQMALLM